MPQPSISYACGRVGVLRRTALRHAQLDRLLAAHDFPEAVRTLTDIGFAATDGFDFQMIADHHVEKACRLIKAVTPEPDVTDCFLFRYDAHNLKVLIKSRHLAQKPQFLSACGTLSVDRLRHCVADHTYGPLPAQFRIAMEALEKRLAVKFDPMLVDTELDKAMYRQIFENLSHSRDAATAITYFRAKADLQNAVMLLRLKAMGKDAVFFQSIALPGGNAPAKALSIAFAEPDKLNKLLQRYGAKVCQAAQDAAQDAARLPFLEKTADDYLYGLFRPYRYDSASLEILIAYLLTMQREATDVRLIMAGKLNGFQPDAVTERMRELHG